MLVYYVPHMTKAEIPEEQVRTQNAAEAVAEQPTTELLHVGDDHFTISVDFVSEIETGVAAEHGFRVRSVEDHADGFTQVVTFVRFGDIALE